MPKLWIDYSDGRFFTRQITDEEAAQRDALDVAYVEDAVWAEYLRHCGNDAIWQALWRAISNDQSMRRRERELQPLEDAEREIRQLKDERDQARRMWKHFEDESTRVRGAVRGGDHRREREFTCIFPQPGCNIDMLRPTWRERAKEILAKYRTDLAAEGMTVQGCCCNYGDHERLHDATVIELRQAGFIVEHDIEYDDESES